MMGPLLTVGVLMPRTMNRLSSLVLKTTRMVTAILKKQAKMVNQAFEALQEKYNFNNFKGLAHSNGGLIYTAFIENYLGDYDVDLKTLMTIGTPYNFTETNIKINQRCWRTLLRTEKLSRQPFICIR